MLADDRPRHWTGAFNGMVGMLRIDGKPFRFMGQSYSSLPAPMKQVRLEVLPARTIYEFEAAGVRLELTFMSPLLPDDLDVLARPVTYVTWAARAINGRRHRVSLYFDCTAEFVVNTTYEKVVWSRPRVGGLRLLSFGSQAQPVLERAGDDLRIDWGYFHLVIPPSASGADVIAWNRVARDSFAADGTLPDSDDMRMPRMAREELPVVAATTDLGEVGAVTVSRHVMVAYDDQFSVEYFRRRLRPYWRRNNEVDALLKAAGRDYEELTRRCEAFDAELMSDLRRAGGEEYARIAALAFRQTIAAHKLAADWDDGDHYRLAFDKPGTWSQKYNLVRDGLLGLNLFPPQVARRELNFYRTKQNRFGLPLDNRETYTKLDWIVWTASLAESQEQFRSFISPIYKFVNETPDRVPLTDWYGTLDGKQRGFQARSVVGGVYIKMLEDAALWKKWSRHSVR